TATVAPSLTRKCKPGFRPMPRNVHSPTRNVRHGHYCCKPPPCVFGRQGCSITSCRAPLRRSSRMIQGISSECCANGARYPHLFCHRAGQEHGSSTLKRELCKLPNCPFVPAGHGYKKEAVYSSASPLPCSFGAC